MTIALLGHKCRFEAAAAIDIQPSARPSIHLNGGVCHSGSFAGQSRKQFRLTIAGNARNPENLPRSDRELNVFQICAVQLRRNQREIVHRKTHASMFMLTGRANVGNL